MVRIILHLTEGLYTVFIVEAMSIARMEKPKESSAIAVVLEGIILQTRMVVAMRHSYEYRR